MKITTLVSTAIFIIFNTMTAIAHQAEIDEHAELIPIPAYQAPEGGASNSAALEAMEGLLNTQTV